MDKANSRMKNLKRQIDQNYDEISATNAAKRTYWVTRYLHPPHIYIIYNKYTLCLDISVSMSSARYINLFIYQILHRVVSIVYISTGKLQRDLDEQLEVNESLQRENASLRQRQR